MRSYAILIHRDPDTGVYLVDIPDLPGVVTKGASEAEAIEMAAHGIRSHLALL